MSALVPPGLLWLAEGLLTALVAGLLFAMAIGALLVMRPQALFRLNARVNRWIDTSGSLRLLEKPRHWERFFYRHHRLLGALIALGAGFVLWQRAFAYEQSAVIALIDPRLSHTGLDWIVAAGDVLIVALHVVALAVGIVVFVRPSLLKAVERAANQWHRGLSTHRLDAVVGHIDTGFAVYPRICGLVVVAASAWCLAGLLPVLERVLTR